MADIEKVTDLTSDKLLGYFESMRSCFYVKLGMLTWLEGGNLEKHRALSDAASSVALELGDKTAARTMATIQDKVVENLKEDAVTALLVAGWSVFELVIKDLTAPDYATQSTMLSLDFHNGILGFTLAEREEITLFYHLRNAVVHYNGAYHAYRVVDATYDGQHFKSVGHFGEKIEMTLGLVVKIVNDLEKYAMKAWAHLGRP
ncbi:hypothetical protein [Caulobacter sp. FWC26]|uniref:hypothetical protein n=1 Tax=Caulobacter sp. FWC26 TaxID=69665 RepID=UPI000C157FD4|nr:hypothetical protein [Caulobacter sp. FWC26]AZS19187.1 hypothetical protein CSW63_00180 [Caulobacter sp. FWC26]